MTEQPIKRGRGRPKGVKNKRLSLKDDPGYRDVMTRARARREQIEQEEEQEKPKPRWNTRGERNIVWIEEHCHLPEGRHVGQPMKLPPYMRDDILAIYDNPHGTRRAIITRGRKNAKALALETPIPTPQGWRTVADIRKGDFIFGADGVPTKVLAVSEIFRGKTCYAVGFSDGSSVVVSADHLWTTRRGKQTRTLTTAVIAKSVLHPRADGVVEHEHKLSCAPAIEMNPIALPIAPYTLGAWLGNGTADSPNVTVNETDVSHYVEQFEIDALGAVGIRRHKDRAPTITITSGQGVLIGFRGKLRVAGLLQNKHIPEIYFSAGQAQRWALLQGLMDTDGTVSQHNRRTTVRCSFTSVLYQLAYGTWRLARSLGLKASIHESRAKLNGRDMGPCWRVAFAASNKEPVFRLRRKQSLLPAYLGKRSRTLAITSCERVESVPTKCLKVAASDSLFLVGHGCVPTHNTTESAAILLLHLCGPEMKVNSNLFSTAQSREQAALVFNLAAKMVRISPKLRGLITIRDTAKELICAQIGTRYRALSAESTTAFGLNPALTIHDELGQVEGPRYPLYDAMETSTGGQDEPLSIIISTQAPTDADLLSILIDDAKSGDDPRVILRMQSAPMDADPFAVETIKLANPAFDVFMNRDEVLGMADDARRMPAQENKYRNLVLNQRVQAVDPFVTQAIWQSCGDRVTDLHGCPLYAGLDLSEVSDLTALVLIGRVGRIWHVKPTFWLPSEGLETKAKHDRVPYDVWKKDGFLETTPGATVAYEYVAHHLKKLFSEYNIKKLGFDRWNMKHLKPWLTHAGFSEQEITEKFVEFGQGTQSMSPALRDLEQLIKDQNLAHGNHPVLAMCAANAVVDSKDAANRKLSKSKSHGRIDGMVALAMAVGVTPIATKQVDIAAMIA